ncbi:ribosome biogenesis GTPase Der [Candidatus Sumerlaeota bacterium]|nr:ribosome biogenesis GTPase Der [Candidatus Sumerlaeota bacterium]
MNALPVIAIVGRPNVGKSTLFNRICGSRKAAVLDTPGVTRDRNYEECEIGGRGFILIDTGGYDPDEDSSLAFHMREQIAMAVEEADAIILIVDRMQPDNPIDREMAEKLRRSGKTCLLAVNKCDNVQQEQEAWGFTELGVGEVHPVSALNGAGVAELLENALESLPHVEAPPKDEDALKIAVVGRPNVGKSTLVNRILGAERVIADSTPGTTRDAIDMPFTRDGRNYVLIDTAGIRRRGKVERGIEKLSVMSALISLKRCDVALILLDAERGITDQDTHIAGYAEESGKLLIFIVNKWDAVPDKDNSSAGDFVKKIRQEFKFLQWVPIQFISAKTGDRVGRIFKIIDELMPQYDCQIPTSQVNDAIQQALIDHSPPMRRGLRLKIKYACQTGSKPPIFSLFVNDPGLIHFSYRRYLVNKLRESFGLTNVPLWLALKRKSTNRYVSDED